MAGVALGIGAFLLGLGIYAYLPVRAAANPPVNWGDASTLEGFVWMLTARAYQDYAFGVSAASLPARFLSWTRLLFDQLTPLGLFLGILGGRLLFLRARPLLFASLVSMALLGLYSMTYNTFDSEVLLVPALMLFSAWVGMGFLGILVTVSDWASSLAAQPRLGGVRMAPGYLFLALALIAFGGLPLASAALNYDDLDLSGDRSAHEYATRVIESVPDGAVLLSTEEGHVFSLWYMAFVERRERDVVPVAVPLLQFDWYWRGLQRRYPGRFPEGPPSDHAEAMRRIVEHNERAGGVYFTYRDRFVMDSFELTPVGNLYQARTRTGP